MCYLYNVCITLVMSPSENENPTITFDNQSSGGLSMNNKEVHVHGSTMDFYRKIIENAPTGYAYHKIILDHEGLPRDYEFIEVNDAFERATGLKREHVIGKRVTEVIPDIRNSEFDWIGFYGELAINGGERETEQFLEALNTWYRINAYSPEHGYFITLLHDITKEKVQIDELQDLGVKLEEQNSYNEMLLSTVPSAVFTVDNECRVTSWNNMAERITGYTKEEIMGQSCKMFAVDPCDTRCGLLDDEVIKPVTCAMCTIKNKHGDRLIVTKNVDVLRDSKGNVIGGIECFEDITERSKSDLEKMKQAGLITSLLDSIPDIIFFKDTEGVFLGCNAPHETFMGKPKREIIGHTDYDFHTADEATFYRQMDKEMLSKLQPVRNEDLVRYPDGREVLLDTLKTPYWGEDGSLIGILGISRDITERKRAEERLRESEVNFRTFFETMDDMIFVTNSQGIIFYTNSAVSNKLGYTTTELQGMYVLEVHPKEKRKEAEQIFGDMFAGKLDMCPLPLATKDGQYIPVETRVWFGKWDGNDCIFGISKDLSLQQAMFDKFHKLFNNNPALMAVSNLSDHKFIEVNNAFVEKLGFSREEIIGRTALDLQLFCDPDKQVVAGYQLEKTGRIQDIELEVRKKDGQIMYGLFSGEIIDNQIEKVFLTVMTDITYKKNAEFEITKISERLKLATKAANVGIWEYDIVKGTLIWDDSMYELYGIPKEMFSGAYEAWENGLHPDDLEKSRQNIQDAINGIRDFDPEFRVVWQDGSIHYIKANAVVLKDLNGNPSKMYGTNWDITEQILSDEQSKEQIQMQNILMHIASQYINISLAEVNSTIQQSLSELGRFVKADRTYIFNYDWEKNVCNNTYEWCEVGIVPQIDELQGVNLELISEWVEAHREGRTMHIADVLALPENNGVRLILEPQEVKSIISIPMMQGNECVGFVGFDSVKSHHEYSENEKKLLVIFASMLVNINMRSILEKNMNDAKEQAEAANLAKSLFLANMSHEIRTPMNGIVGFLELLRTSNMSLEQKEFIREAKAASEVLLYIINDILDFSKIEAGKLGMEKIDFNIRTAIKDAVSLIIPKASEKNLIVHRVIEDNVPVEVIGDPSRLRQILSNLLSNAVKFTEQGQVSLTVECIKEENDYATIQFVVKDTGIGISKESMGNLFQSFNQADATTTRKYGGTGLGLAISKELIKMMDGSIRVESTEGEGSIFSFYICVKIVQKAVVIKEPASMNDEISYVEDGIQSKLRRFRTANKPTILLVEDNEMNRKIVMLMLKNRAMSCDIATNGKEAYMAVRKKEYDIVFMDCQMPIMDGYESTTKIREDEGDLKHTTIIAMTANTMEGDKTKCFAAGMDDYISKPIDFELMFQLIDKYSKQQGISDEKNAFIDNNITRFMESTGMEMEDATDIFNEFIVYLPRIMSEIRVSIDQNSFDELRKFAHQLKGAAGNLRITSMYELALQLEKAANEQKLEECERLFNELKGM